MHASYTGNHSGSYTTNRAGAQASQPKAPAFDLALASPQQQAVFHWFRTSRVPAFAAYEAQALVSGEAAEVEATNLVVRARAGCGKTTTIVAGVELAPEQTILLAAFNKSIASELQGRITNPRVEAKTLHALGFKFCIYNWKKINLDDMGQRATTLAIAATTAVKATLSMRAARNNPVPEQAIKLVANLHSKGREIQPFATSGHDLVDLAVAFNLLPDEQLTAAGWDETAICHAAYRAMVLATKRPANNLIDFADMIYLPLANNWVRAWYDLVVVDEAQDMTEAQLELARRCCKRGGRICVVGDDRQAIYGFRGADSAALDNLKRALKAAELGLTVTRRCPQRIVTLAQALVPDFEAAPEAPEGQILRCDADSMIAGASEGDFILSRTNAPLVKICLALLKRGVRARVKGRDIGRGIQALVRKLAPASLAALEGLLTEWASHETERALAKLPEGPRETRIDFVNDQAAVILALAEGADSLDALDRRIADLFTDEGEARVVMCSSVHKAKGLEAKRVYRLVGTFRDGSTEEQNITYVAITRVQETLVEVSGYEK